MAANSIRPAQVEPIESAELAVLPPRRRFGGVLPAPLSPLIGREQAIADVRARLENEGVRLLTLTGPGGSGKTRLALAAAAEIEAAGSFADGVVFVPLAPLADPAQVLPAVVAGLGLREASDVPPAATLAPALWERRVLLVMDNFEHVTAAASAIAELLTACPTVAALVTSREWLRIGGERCLAVAPLDLPRPSDEPAAVAATEAVRLFVTRARSADQTLTLGDADIVVVGEICRRLEGLPLAIELAAARLTHLAPAALLARLEPRLPLLTQADQDAPARHRTMRDAIAWSYDLLSPEEQALFGRLAVFADGFTLEAAEAIGRGATLDLVASLVEKSLVRYVPEAPGGPRYLVLETIREYAAERLANGGEEEATRRAHAAYFVAFAERHELSPFAPFAPGMQEVLAAERVNLEATLRWLAWAGEPDRLVRLTAALGWFWWIWGEVRTGTEWLDRARALGEGAGTAETRLKIAQAVAYLAFAANDYQRAATMYAEVHQRAVALGDARYEISALVDLGHMSFLRGAHDEAMRRSREALTLARAQADPELAALGAALALIDLGGTAREQGQPREAATSFEEALSLLQSTGHTYYTMHCLGDLGDVALDLGDLAGADRRFREALRLALAFGHRRVVVRALAGLASVAAFAGGAAQAARLFGAVERMREATGIAVRPPADRAVQERAIAGARDTLGQTSFAAAWAGGRGLFQAGIDELVAELVAPESDAQVGQAVAPALTPREAEILALLVAEQTNRAIGEALFVSERTVDSHVARIFRKLAVRTRAEAIAAARRTGLVALPPGPDR